MADTNQTRTRLARPLSARISAISTNNPIDEPTPSRRSLPHSPRVVSARVSPRSSRRNSNLAVAVATADGERATIALSRSSSARPGRSDTVRSPHPTVRRSPSSTLPAEQKSTQQSESIFKPIPKVPALPLNQLQENHAQQPIERSQSARQAQSVCEMMSTTSVSASDSARVMVATSAREIRETNMSPKGASATANSPQITSSEQSCSTAAATITTDNVATTNTTTTSSVTNVHNKSVIAMTPSRLPVHHSRAASPLPRSLSRQASAEPAVCEYAASLLNNTG